MKKILMAALSASLAAATSHSAAAASPKVVELFTSQGCSSCPPANANLIRLSHRPGVLVLSFAVTYWDNLGWKDTFGQPGFTARQVSYEPPLGESGPFTPQMVINGAHSLVGNEWTDVEARLAAAPPLKGAEVAITNGTATVAAGSAPAGGADVWLVHYDPETVIVDVPRGENAGHRLAHTHVVHRLEHLGSWSGKAASWPLPASDGFKTAVLVQVRGQGALLGAATD